MKSSLLIGNEAIALGAYEAGAKVAVGYPGTPSTEILESISVNSDIYTEWSVNEKVALEVGIGSAISGARTLVTMKHVGLNVAADPLFTSAYIGVKGGLVIVNADDPGMHSSQNEQDNRNYARAAKLPMLEPANSQEAKDYTKLAFELSEQYDVPVIIRTVTRICHSYGIVNGNPADRSKSVEGFTPNKQKFVMLPAFARKRHQILERSLQHLAKAANTLHINKMEINDKRVGFITSGICYNYIKEYFPLASALKIGMINPLPEEMIREFCNQVNIVMVVEELDPYLETIIKSWGLDVEGKKYFPVTGELTPTLIKRGVEKVLKEKNINTAILSEPIAINSDYQLPSRLPTFCKGCPHRNIFKVLKKRNLIVSGDIGCYTLGALPPYNAIDTCIEMGGSIGIAQGMEIAMGDNYRNDTVAVIGDSTFAHSGITSLLNAVYNKRKTLVIVLDNGSTAMTGNQENPLTGKTIGGENTIKLDYTKLGQAVGISEDRIRKINAFDMDKIEKTVVEFLQKGEISLIIIKGLCVLHKKKALKKEKIARMQYYATCN